MSTSPRTTRRRLSARAARLVLAREMWARANGVWEYAPWDNDELLSTVYEKHIEKADRAIREEMDRV